VSEAVAFLERVKSRLLSTGWRKYGLGNPEGPNCLVGAAYWETWLLHGNTYSSWTYSANERWALIALWGFDYKLDDTFYSALEKLTNWNDEEHRTFNEVIARIDDAIVRVKEEEAA